MHGIHLSANARTVSVDCLQAILADGIDLALLTKHAHWNLKGSRFIALHEMLDGFRSDLDGHVDATAERIVQLGAVAEGSVQAVAASTRLPVYPDALRAEEDHLAALAERYAALVGAVREGIDQTGGAGDAVTADILTGFARSLDKALWLVEAHAG
ncbi:DNA starvation/stationary phase protection protein Dps [Acuticoccus sediminis]|uniref:DNA starvation/stationary phase protection protein Dps n=1 Tax=Acuticoccus sediminis TaxID=2184697 RepID=UPI001CFD323C|nr:DNA starvation/stationary phase protection protein Dps [Acuticoccus sediminis]